jgi:isoleucyl-tRNA synthetase
LLPDAVRGNAQSVHLAAFPEAMDRWADPELARRWEDLLAVRREVQNKLEEQRRGKVIGSSLEAIVRLEANPDRYELLKRYEDVLPSLFIVSQVELKAVTHLAHSPDVSVTVMKAPDQKCERCWNYLPTVGKDREHPTLCHRCLGAIR